MKYEFSVVVPVLNEEKSISELVSKTQKAFADLKKSFEIIFIDDGSTDSTFSILKDLESKEENVRVFSFRRNLGKSHAMMLGFAKAQGQYILTLDGDLQDDPKNVRAMFEKMTSSNLDIVTGWRKNRKDAPHKILSSKLFNSLVSYLFGITVNDMNSGLKLYKADAAKELKLYGGMHRFVPVIANEMGFFVGEVPTSHFKRKYGVSKYKSTKIFSDIPDLITIYFLTKYTRRPLHFFGKIGGSVFGIGILILLYLSYLHFIGQAIGDRPLLLFGVLLVIAGIQTMFTGLLADLFVNLSTKEETFPLRYESKK
jgi:glycosyltransferase involved in cell wall biosynthesis